MRFVRWDLLWWFAAGLVGLILLRLVLWKPYAASTTVKFLRGFSYRASFVRRAPIVLLLASLVLIVFALMNPVVKEPETIVQSRGRDIVMVLDMSDSMQTEMFENGTSKTRLDAVKDAMRSFVLSRKDDRIALILFSENAYVMCPLTFDHTYLLQYIDLVDKNSIQGEGRTAIGDALLAASDLLGQQTNGGGKRNQMVMLFTDGENDAGSDPVVAIAQLHAENIGFNVVGIALNEAENKVEVQRFIDAVHMNDGRYFDASTPSDVEDASHTIDQLEVGLLSNKVSSREDPVYSWFAIPALLCLVAAVTLRAVPFFVDQA